LNRSGQVEAHDLPYSSQSNRKGLELKT